MAPMGFQFLGGAPRQLIINGGGSSYDPDAQAYFDEVENQGGFLSPTYKTEFDSFVIDCKINGGFMRLKRFYPFSGGVVNSARIDLITRTSLFNLNLTDVDCNPITGVNGDGATKCFLETDNINTILSSENIALGVIFPDNTVNINSFGSCIGYYVTEGLKITSINFDTSNRVRGYSPTISYQALHSSKSLFNSLILVRESETSLKTIVDDSVAIDNDELTPGLLPSVRSAYLGRSQNDEANIFYEGPQLGAFLGENMSESQVLFIKNRYRSFLTNIGVI